LSPRKNNFRPRIPSSPHLRPRPRSRIPRSSVAKCRLSEVVGRIPLKQARRPRNVGPSPESTKEPAEDVVGRAILAAIEARRRRRYRSYRRGGATQRSATLAIPAGPGGISKPLGWCSTPAENRHTRGSQERRPGRPGGKGPNSNLVPRSVNTVAFDRACIPARFVALARQ
jgi:hypothetical protein